MKYGQNLYYYDVNSLYPFVMKKEMPFEPEFWLDGNEIDINTFFGFALVKVHCPLNITVPFLPYRDPDSGKTIHPVGNWVSMYFSEEIKAAMEIGYTFEFLRGISFTKRSLFNEYIDHFYGIKKTHTGATRWIAKLHLNTLYGIFGRKLDNITTILVERANLAEILATNVVDNVYNINEDLCLVLLRSTQNPEFLANINSVLEEEDNLMFASDVKSNVAIAAAITAYARTHMLKFKIAGEVLYTDTDSIITTSPLDPSLINNELGMMKDELGGLLIKEAYILGIKQYGYWYLDNENNRIERSVVAGIKRNSLPFDVITNLAYGGTYTTTIPNQFRKSMINFNLSIDSITKTIKIDPSKKLVGNIYLPPVINNNNHVLYRDSFLKSVANQYNYIVNKVKSWFKLS